MALDVYYRLYYVNGKISVVTMQDFDESGYIQRNFVTDGIGVKLKFSEELNAIKYLNDNFVIDVIHPDSILPNHPSHLRVNGITQT